MGMIPKTTKAETKVFAGKDKNWLLGLVMTLMMAYAFGQKFVHAAFTLPFLIFVIVVYILLQRPAPSNPKRPMWQGLVLWLLYLRDSACYASIIGYAYKERREKLLEQHRKSLEIRH